MNTTVFPAFRTTDVDRTIALLEALGFTEHLLIRNPEDSSVVEHAEFSHLRGGVMFGSARGDASELDRQVGSSSCYIVVDNDDEVDASFTRAVDAGATVVDKPNDKPYGGRGAAVRDHDGNVWSIGSYAGA
ncbi:VOC family protein [Corynebacterium lubricantis]|uniref:VOC family protein n=1 Tax=Corynebacterium lubricantis TaxID=541095 RepID=UPI00035E1B71|nr:VOC family protein [Corynebacterium lubricantis]